ncbi:unnamed protein product [Rhizoctonia solani]|uniref:Uncharacterized protein n=1 Tax=Rhizoctonia solani TaxID=456999 RepID=A0A8H3HPE3_9AGAM|nr:unnamed protein product [Rhizoctonia solani]
MVGTPERIVVPTSPTTDPPDDPLGRDLLWLPPVLSFSLRLTTRQQDLGMIGAIGNSFGLREFYPPGWPFPKIAHNGVSTACNRDRTDVARSHSSLSNKSTPVLAGSSIPAIAITIPQHDNVSSAGASQKGERVAPRLSEIKDANTQASSAPKNLSSRTSG